MKGLAYNSSLDRLEALFSFDEDKVKEGEHFLAILVAVNEKGDKKPMYAYAYA